MSLSDKRRSFAGIPTRLTRNESSSSITTRNTAAPASSTNEGFIAPPPRAQLHRPSSPSPSSKSIDTASITTVAQRSASPAGASTSSRRSSNAASLGASNTVTATISAANQVLLREKDARITALENELLMMETEFTQQLDRLSQNESESSTFWQSQHAQLLARLEAAEMAAHEQMANERAILQAQMREKDDEIGALKTQVRGLKEWVSTSTRAVMGGEEQMSDDVLREKWERLAMSLQNWVISHYRKAVIREGLSNEEVAASTGFDIDTLVPECVDLLQTSARTHVLQAVSAFVLKTLILDQWFIGVDDDTELAVETTEEALSQYVNREAISQWRNMSTTALYKALPGGLMAKHRDGKIMVAAKRIEHCIAVLISVPADSNAQMRRKGLEALIAQAIDLQRLLAIQKRGFEAWWPRLTPHQQVLYDANVMDDVGGEEEDELMHREISCVTFPGLRRLDDQDGDEDGEKTTVCHNVIARAKVLCKPD